MSTNARRRKARVRVTDVTNYRNSINYECNHCGYVCHGLVGGKLHLKYSHGIDEKNVETKQFCTRCKTTFTESVSKHMIQHREEI